MQAEAPGQKRKEARMNLIVNRTVLQAFNEKYGKPEHKREGHKREFHKKRKAIIHGEEDFRKETLATTDEATRSKIEQMMTDTNLNRVMIYLLDTFYVHIFNFTT